MPHPMLPDDARPCLWMSAGLVTYKLCDRGFDCEHCPLDAALRGEPRGWPRGEALSEPGRRAAIYPSERLYTTGHLWVLAVPERDGKVLRLGLDAFAAALLGRCRQVVWAAAEAEVPPHGTVCEIDIGPGSLALTIPLAGRLLRGNTLLESEPGVAVTDPYGEGWLVEMQVEGPDGLGGLLTADAAREQARLDLRRFRRRIALHLLADSGPVGPTLADGGRPLTDLRQILGGRTYLQVLRELIH